ncbi:type II secretion system F family protein, partial [Pseudomonadota bacterium]
MAIFSYKGMNAKGSIIRGRIDAVNDVDLEQRLENMGLELINCKEVVATTSFVRGRRISRQELIGFCFHMEQMSRVGVPIIESLQDLRDSMENPRFRDIISAMVASIEGGKTFSEALSEFPNLFDEVFVSLVKAGEQSGELSTVLLNMTESLKWQDEITTQTKKVLMYPAFIGVIVLGVVFFLMLYLVPQMVGFIENMGHEIPGHTKF